MADTTVWVAEVSYDYEGSEVRAVFRDEAAALAWLNAAHAKAIEQEDAPSPVIRKEAHETVWWEFEEGSRTCTVTEHNVR